MAKKLKWSNVINKEGDVLLSRCNLGITLVRRPETHKLDLWEASHNEFDWLYYFRAKNFDEARILAVTEFQESFSKDPGIDLNNDQFND